MPPPRRSIACAYCGGAHPTADEVRACWQRSNGVEVRGEVGLDTAPSLFADGAAPVAESATALVAPATSPFIGAIGRGPAQLGRHALVALHGAAPPPWADAPRLVVERVDEHTVGELQRRAAERVGCVIEVRIALDELTREATDEPPHRLGAHFTFAGEALAHLVLTNAVDHREGDGRWPLLDHAIALGARPADDGRGDVVLPDGSRAWLDGGPPRFTPPIDGVAVVPRVGVEHGSLHPPIDNTTTADLAPDQLAAVVHDGGAARIIAPAGSGKTRVLTERARHLVQRWRVPASAICLVAFNKRAQQEMHARTSDVPGLQVRTLNSIALAVVNGTPPFAPQPQRVSTITEPDVRRAIGRLVTFPRKRNADPIATWIEALSSARLGLLAPDVVEARYDGDVDGFAAVLPRFRAHLASQGQVDYDEQVQRAIELLLLQPDARAAAQRACRFMLVDEFQDLTPAHLLLVRLLAGPDGAVFAVGDDDQTIYGYNGADPSWLIDFASLFPGAGAHPLEVNYRCPDGVVRAADTLLRHNRRRVAKVIRGADASHDGFLVAPAESDSVATTVGAVRRAITAGLSPTDIAVLTRVNSLLAPVQVALHGAGVPVDGGVGVEFADRTAVRAELAWLRLATATGDSLRADDVAEALRRPSRSLHPRVAEWVGEQRSLDGLRRLAERVTNDRDAQRIVEFTTDIERLQRLIAAGGTTADVVRTVRDQMGLATSISTLDANRRGMNRAAQQDDLTALSQLASLHDDAAGFESWMRRALAVRSDTGVTLATVHRVKGQEWPFVIVHHADADQFPHRLADDDEEERRLFHVAITRAARDVLVVPSDRPSPFILECSTEPSAVRRQRVAASTSTPASRRPKAAPGDGLSDADRRLFDALRETRRHLAAGKPAYVVLPDAALHEIALRHPSSLDQLAAVRGVGPTKLTQYGEAILRVVAEHPPAGETE